jgi:hypothetical protein
VEFIDLSRNFAVVAKDAEPNLAMGRIWGRRIGGWLEWSDLLDRSRVVLLAEASSGKSAEFHNTAAALRRRGNQAFYCTIEQLADGKLIAGMDAADAAAFAQWRAGTEPAWFFLDSVDEARLNRKKFDDALRCLSRELGAELSRTRILVSCRNSDWKGTADLTAFLSILPITPPSVPPSPPPDPDAALLDPIFADREKPDDGGDKPADTTVPLVVRLIPLSSEQQQTLAAASGISQPTDFVAAIGRSGLDALAERPGDLLELAAYWKTNGRFGSLAEMTEHAVTVKLSEIDRYRPDNSALSLAKAREGAERLAATLTLGKSFTLRAPAQEPDPELATGALDPAAALDDWTEAEINALLRRGIFNPSTYGRVRFHHRGTQEYLTAQWLDRLLRVGCPQKEIWNLLFAERYGVETVAPSMRAAASWLALKQPAFRDEIIRREPLMLIQHGDPGSLPLETREGLLLALAERHAAGEIADDNVDNRALWMFAAPQLAPAIRRAWSINARPEFRFDLLRLIREGKIGACSDLARDVALDTSAQDYHRIVAALALQECEDGPSLTDLSKHLRRNASTTPARVAAEFAAVLFPKYLTLSQLITVMSRAPAPRKNTTEGFSQQIAALWEACPLADRERMMAAIVAICATPPFVSDYQRVSQRHVDLAQNLEPVARSALAGLGAKSPPRALIELLATIERADRHSRREDDKPHLSEFVRRDSAVQRELFWHDVADVRSQGRAVTAFWHTFFGGDHLWGLGPNDLHWLRDDLAARPLEDDRRVALSAILAILRDQKTLGKETRTLRRQLAGEPALLGDLNSFLAPPKKSARPRASRRKGRERDQAKAMQSWRRFREELIADPSQLSDPSRISTGRGWLPLFNLTKWLRHRTGKDDSEAALQWRLLGEAFPPEIVAAYAEGMRHLWRVTEPERPERKPGGAVTVKWVTILSFAAVGVEAASDRDWAGKLSPDEARRAALHGCVSEQGYPEWIDALLIAHPSSVVPIVHDAFESEWLEPDNSPTQFVYRFGSSGVESAALRREVLNTIVRHEPPKLVTLDYGLRILTSLKLEPEERAIVKKLALAGLKRYAASDAVRAIRFIAMLFLVDAPGGVAALIAWLDRSPRKSRNEWAVQIVGALFGRHDPLAPAALTNMTVPALEKLVRFIYANVKPQDDNVHEGSYTPDARDDAEGGRNAVLKALLDTAGEESHSAMIRLSRSRLVPARSLRFRELARGMAERDTESPAWSPVETLTLERRYLLPVKTAEDLYRVVLDVLDEIIWDFDNQDASSRAVLETAKHENAVQHWAAEQLRLRAHGRYHVHREAEVAEGNMPDILISGTTTPFEVAVEAKHGDKGWTLSTLTEAIKDQLAEDYLRPGNRRSGVFIVTCHKKKRWQDSRTGKLLDFQELIERLAKFASTLTRNTVGSVIVRVRGIDAAPRPRRRSPAKKQSTRPTRSH